MGLCQLWCVHCRTKLTEKDAFQALDNIKGQVSQAG